MNTLFMALASFNGKVSQKTSPEMRSDHPQASFAHSLLVHQLYDPYFSQLRTCDDANYGISGPYDDDGKPE